MKAGAQMALNSESSFCLPFPIFTPKRGCSTASVGKLLCGSGGNWIALWNVALLDIADPVQDFILQHSGFFPASLLRVLSGQGWDTLLGNNHSMPCIFGRDIHRIIREGNHIFSAPRKAKYALTTNKNRYQSYVTLTSSLVMKTFSSRED